MAKLAVTSPAFENNTRIPRKYTCEGEDISPPLEFSGIPGNAESLVLIVDDPDAPDPANPKMVWDHWILWNIPPGKGDILENTVPEGAVQGRNGWGRNEYGGPCPPIGRHRYFFKLYALDCKLDLSTDAGKEEVEGAMEGHILDKTELIGLYEKGQ